MSGSTEAKTAIRPEPPKPDLALYSHLSEKERMIAGFPYKPSDQTLRDERLKARELTRQFNDSPVAEKALRKSILKKLLNPSSGDDVFIEPNFRCDYGYNLTIGKGTEINFDFVALDCAPITIGKHVLIAPSVHIYAATHPLCPVERLDYELAKPVTIGDHVWIGGHVTICPGVTIGNGVTIGAGAVVTKDVPANVVVAGNPAKIIRHLPEPQYKDKQ